MTEAANTDQQATAADGKSLKELLHDDTVRTDALVPSRNHCRRRPILRLNEVQ